MRAHLRSKLLVPLLQNVEISNLNSFKLLVHAGYIRQSMAGANSLLPLGLRVQEKIKRIVQEELDAVDCQQISLPVLQSSHAWKSTDRWEGMGSEMLKLVDRHETSLCLAPTHEEEITKLVSELALSYRNFPLRLYQFGLKFRDEPRTKPGLLRAREFTMKDLYSFDTSTEEALSTYNIIREAYKRIFFRIGLHDVVEMKADSGAMGGELSHEFLLSSIGTIYYVAFHVLEGENTVHVCQKCHNPQLNEGACESCETGVTCPSPFVEIAHTFLLGQRYSLPLQANFIRQDGHAGTIEMGCYGIGVSRLVGAIASRYRSDQGFQWPISVAPFLVNIISSNQKMDEKMKKLAISLSSFLGDDAIIDDRDARFGYKIHDNMLHGFPCAVILNDLLFDAHPFVEIEWRSDIFGKLPFNSHYCHLIQK